MGRDPCFINEGILFGGFYLHVPNKFTFREWSRGQKLEIKCIFNCFGENGMW